MKLQPEMYNFDQNSNIIITNRANIVHDRTLWIEIVADQ